MKLISISGKQLSHILKNLNSLCSAVQAFRFSCIHTRCVIEPLYNALFTQCTVYHSWAWSSCTDPVESWLIAPSENLTEFPAVFQKVKGKGKCHLLQSRGGTFWPHSSRLSVTKTKEMNVSIFQTTATIISYDTDSSFLYSAHVRASRAPTAGLQNLRASPPVSTFGPSDNVTTGNLGDRFHNDTGSVCLSTVKPRTAQPHRAAEWGAVSLSIE